MKNPDIYPQLLKVLGAVSPEVPAEKIKTTALLISDLNIDSLKVAELSVMLEEAFQVPIFVPELLTRVDDPYRLTVESLAALVEEKLASGGVRSS